MTNLVESDFALILEITLLVVLGAAVAMNIDVGRIILDVLGTESGDSDTVITSRSDDIVIVEVILVVVVANTLRIVLPE